MTYVKGLPYKASDILNAKERFEETRDPFFALLAIGNMPHSPPNWAIEACAVIKSLVEKLPDKGNDRFNLSEELDDMWRFLFSTPEYNEDGTLNCKAPPVIEAARHVVRMRGKQFTDFENPWIEDRNCFHAAVHHLQKAFGDEMKMKRVRQSPRIEWEVFDGIYMTERGRIIFWEDASKRYGLHSSDDPSLALFRARNSEGNS